MSTKIKSAMTLFFEYHPEFSDDIKEMYLHIERTQLESAYFTGKVQYDSGKSEQQFFDERY